MLSRFVITCYVEASWVIIVFGISMERLVITNLHMLMVQRFKEILVKKWQTCQKSFNQQAVPESLRETLALEERLDAIDQMLRDGESECLDARNLKKLEQMKNDAKTPLFSGCRLSKLEANLML